MHHVSIPLVIPQKSLPGRHLSLPLHIHPSSGNPTVQRATRKPKPETLKKDACAYESSNAAEAHRCAGKQRRQNSKKRGCKNTARGTHKKNTRYTPRRNTLREGTRTPETHKDSLWETSHKIEKTPPQAS
mmetsp:Transcript_45816/g.90246  ORF Transcript_45816/g.90246 Transcript_45816/m.90246 type:complete len:130 (+) Transcript_45816:323-712(+)